MKSVINKAITVAIATFVLTLPFSPSRGVDLYRHVTLDNGIEAAVCTPEAVMEHLTVRDGEGRLLFRLPEGMSYLLIEDTAHQAIVNKGDGSFHPMPVEEVLRALAEIDVGGRRIDCILEVYILPYPRYGFLRSTASGNRIFLSPGVIEPGVYFTAFTVTHEFGHVFQHTFVPIDGSDRWENYLGIRGILDDPLYAESAQHRNRPREIFAEDFRYLFGGGDACYTNSIENTSLICPDAVEGLEAFFVSLLSPVVASAPDGGVPPHGGILSSVNYPNPFNPTTTIEVAMAEPVEGQQREAELSVYRADGSLVRTVYHGELINTVFRAVWDGRDAHGVDAPSGVYFYRFSSGPAIATGKMLLVR